MTSPSSVPQEIVGEDQLEERLTAPSAALVEQMSGLRGNLVILGAGGKMGPSLAVKAQRAVVEAGSDLKIVAVSRFSDEASRRQLEDQGISTMSADLLDRRSLDQLPDADNVIFLVGSKFGTSQNPSQTWAANMLTPANAMDRYRQARFVALSTGNVYPLTGVQSGGCSEADPVGPVGEYAYAALGRERIIEYQSKRHDTAVALIRLNYATDLRYGVLTDIATRVVRGEAVNVANGYLNCIWQGDANDAILRALPLAESPVRVLNLTGPETLSVRKVAQEFGRLLDVAVEIEGEEADTALLSDASEYCKILGPPSVSAETLIRWTAGWMRQKGRLLNKPTHFEVRDGVF